MSQNLVLFPNQRELEMLELQRDRTQTAVDAVDEDWPKIRAAAAYVKDCKKALMDEGFSEDVAIMLLPHMLRLLGRG